MTNNEAASTARVRLMDRPPYEGFEIVTGTPPDNSVTFDQATQIFELWVYPGCYPYEITLGEVRNYPKLAMWLGHLSGKCWFTREVLWDFLHLWHEVTGLPIHGDITSEEPAQGVCRYCGQPTVDKTAKKRAAKLAKMGRRDVVLAAMAMD